MKAVRNNKSAISFDLNNTKCSILNGFSRSLLLNDWLMLRFHTDVTAELDYKDGFMRPARCGQPLVLWCDGPESCVNRLSCCMSAARLSNKANCWQREARMTPTDTPIEPVDSRQILVLLLVSYFICGTRCSMRCLYQKNRFRNVFFFQILWCTSAL